MRSKKAYKQVLEDNQEQGVPLDISFSAQSSTQLPLQSMDSMQSMGSSDATMMQSISQSNHLNQTFQVKCNNITFMVDLNCLMNSSLKFKELIDPYIKSNQQSRVHLEILAQDFSNRGINNFFRICQNLPSDVQNSEMKEMCEIAKLFKANQIYNTGLSFVQNTIDPNFSVPDDKYELKSYLMIKEDNNTSSHPHNLDDFEFDDNDHNKNDFNGFEFDDNDHNNNGHIENDHNKSDFEFDDEHNKHDLNDLEFDDNDQKKNEHKKNEPIQDKIVASITPADNDLLEDGKSKVVKAKFGGIIYQIKCETRPLKPTIYQFLSNGHVLYTAKHKENNIYISEGLKVHIKRGIDEHVCHIHQSDDDYNLIHLNDQDIRLNYVKSGKPNMYSIEVSFTHEDKVLKWSPKPPKYDAMSNKYYHNFRGEYGRTAIRSKRNIVLQNPEGRRTFIVRKMDLFLYEAELSPVINPLIAFAIALSDIVGPYMDPFADIEIPKK